MAFAHISLLILIFYHYLILVIGGTSKSDVDHIRVNAGGSLRHGPIRFIDSPTLCTIEAHPVDIADCLEAIDKIPPGKVYFDPAHPGDRNRDKPIDILFTSPGRERRITLPAVFQSKSCVILVFSHRGREKAPTSVKAATALYFSILPDAKAAAEKIVKKCLKGKNDRVGGTKLTSSRLGNALIQYWVTVGAVPPHARDDGDSAGPSRMGEKRTEAALERPGATPGRGRYR